MFILIVLYNAVSHLSGEDFQLLFKNINIDL